MTPRWIVRKGCMSKRRYADQADAIGKACYRVKKGAQPLRPYECGICGGWHLTSKIKQSNHTITGPSVSGGSCS